MDEKLLRNVIDETYHNFGMLEKAININSSMIFQTEKGLKQVEKANSRLELVCVIGFGLGLLIMDNLQGQINSLKKYIVENCESSTDDKKEV